MEINLFQKEDFKQYTLVEGFPGIGLVGAMAVSYMIDKLKMNYIGYIDSKNFPPIIAIHDSEPMPAVRLYCSEKSKVVLFFSEFAIPTNLVTEISDLVYRFIKDNGIIRIISISGIPSAHVESDDTFAIFSKSSLSKEVQSAGMKTVKDGVSSGVSAMLMKNCIIDNDKNIDMINILVPVEPNIVDPKYAELAILSINKLIGLNIDVKELDKEAKDVEAKIRDAIKKSNESKQVYKRSVESESGSDESSIYG